MIRDIVKLFPPTGRDITPVFPHNMQFWNYNRKEPYNSGGLGNTLQFLSLKHLTVVVNGSKWAWIIVLARKKVVQLVGGYGSGITNMCLIYTHRHLRVMR